MAKIYCVFVHKTQNIYMGSNLSAISRKLNTSYQALQIHTRRSNYYSNSKYSIFCIEKENFMKRPGNYKGGFKKQSKKLAI